MHAASTDQILCETESGFSLHTTNVCSCSCTVISEYICEEFFFLSIGMQKKIKATGTKVAINKTA